MDSRNSSNEHVNIFQVVRRANIDLYRKNIDKFDIDTRNGHGQSLLHKAVAYGKNEIAIDLLDRGIDVNLQDENGQTALHFIGFHPNTVLTRRIIEKGGNLELRDSYGNTPLWYAVVNARGQYELVELFVKYHPDPTLKNNAGRSPIDFAVQIGDETLLDILNKSR